MHYTKYKLAVAQDEYDEFVKNLILGIIKNAENGEPSLVPIEYGQELLKLTRELRRAELKYDLDLAKNVA